MIENISKIIHAKFGWIVLFFVGGISSFAFAPFFMIPLLIPAFVFIAYILKMPHSKKQIFAYSFWLFLGHFVFGLYWVSISLFIDIAKFWFLVPFSVFLLPAYIAIYPAFAVMLCNQMKIQNDYLEALVFAVLWVVFEILRGILLTGFPWNMIGYVFAGYLTLLQSASLLGIYGLSFAVVFMFILLAKYILENRISLLIGPIILFTAMLFFGWYRLENNPTSFTDKSVKIVQANIEQKLKWDESEMANNLMKHLRLSKDKPADYVVWSESSFPNLVDVKYRLSSVLTEPLGKDALLITGAVRTDTHSRDFKIWNSIIAINKQGEITDYYDKVKLVPFGEFVPLQEFLPINKITHGAQNFEFSENTKPYININGMKVLGLICYEAIFSGLNYHKNVAYDYILNLTNDAWFGNSTGPYQHYYMAKTRAVELGIPLVRAAGTGISGVIDSLGRDIIRSELGKEAVLDSLLPKPYGRTLYAYLLFH